MLFKFFKRHFLSKVNIKIKKKGLFTSPDRILGITFVLSIVFHAGLICTLPAVDLFSEGLQGPLSDMIVVDFVQEEPSEGQPEVPQPIDNQFLASNPTEPDMISEENPPQPLDDFDPNRNDVEMTIPLPKEKSLEMETQYTLLANSDAHDLEFEQLRKRPVKRDRPVQQKIPELPKSAKLPVKPKEPQPVETKRPLSLQRPKPSIAPTRIEKQKKDKPEEDLHFPLEVHRPEERQSSTEDLPEKMFGFGKRPAKEMDRETTFSSTQIDVAPHSSKKRWIGLSKENEEDENRFGIFAGEIFELPKMKEMVQEAFAEEEKKEATLFEETETAKNLETNGQIEGPVKGRAIVYQPPPPQVDIVNEVEFRLKFWVLPDGTIGEVIPFKRGDAKLERIAISYLKKWQFKPLPPEAPQQKIWGTIPIRFTTDY